MSNPRFEPDFFRFLSPVIREIVRRRLNSGDVEGADYLMRNENADIRRRYELWKMNVGLLEKKMPQEWKSGPSRMSMSELEVERQERRRAFSRMMMQAAEREKQLPSKNIYTSTLTIQVPLTIIVPQENEERVVSTAIAILGLRSDYY